MLDAAHAAHRECPLCAKSGRSTPSPALATPAIGVRKWRVSRLPRRAIIQALIHGPHPAMTHEIAAAERTLLRALIDRIVPEDGDPGALALGADRYVFAQLEGPLVADRAPIAAGLAALPGDFVAA